jgi:hypothetical protein
MAQISLDKDTFSKRAKRLYAAWKVSLIDRFSTEHEAMLSDVDGVGYYVSAIF